MKILLREVQVKKLFDTITEILIINEQTKPKTTKHGK